jgi:solute carrier family 25 phosphate transporter 23/24/25/41
MRLQAQGTPSHPTFYTSSFDVISKTYQREGLVGFYRGLAPTLIKVLPAISISYFVYEKSKRALGL